MRLLVLTLLLALAGTAHAAPAPTPFGLWQNPKGTIVVRTHGCGPLLCGDIVWAGPKAIADARDAGVTALVGTELLSNYRASGAGRWTGQVYVPDQGRRFYSTIELKTSDSLRISGCILGGLICKHQEWTRR
ncbi:DUF2147 domain-containing protein [Sphingopyxis fribergensis]